MELKCIDCGVLIERTGRRGPQPLRCPEHRRLKRNAGRRAYYAANREAQIAAVRAWQVANPEKKRANDEAWYAADRDGINQRRREWAAANPGRDSAAHRRRHYGLTPERYQALLVQQGGTCAIDGCNATEGHAGRQLYVDHDHDCCPGNKSCGDCVRGLLCGNHNAGMGQFQDDPALLRAAADYLETRRLRVVTA